MKELIIANNMIAMARGHKPKHHAPVKKGKHAKPHVEQNKTPAQKRSAMLKMIMPFLSRETGEKLALAIVARNPERFGALWDQVKKEIIVKLEAQKHGAFASSNPERDFAFGLNYEDAEKLVSVFKWVLTRLCDQTAAVDPCPLEPMTMAMPGPPPVEVAPETPVEVVQEVSPPTGIDAYPQIAELYARMLASNMQV